MKSLLATSILFFCIAFSTISFAQQEVSDPIRKGIIHLKGGGKLYGKILEIREDTLTFEMINGDIVNIETLFIKKVVQKIEHGGIAKFKFYQKKPYKFRERGIYNTTYLNVPQGYSSYPFNFSSFSGDTYSYWVLGLGIHHVTGWQHNRWVGTGVGLGFDGYYLGYGRNILSVYGECRGYFLPQRVSPYYSIGLGYGFGMKNPQVRVLANKGGLFFSPSLGYRFGGSEGVNFVLGFGYRLQIATITDRSRRLGSISTQKYTFNRINTTFGLLF